MIIGITKTMSNEKTSETMEKTSANIPSTSGATGTFCELETIGVLLTISIFNASFCGYPQ